MREGRFKEASRSLRVASLVVGVVLATTGTAWTADSAPADPVVARVNNQDIKRSEVMRAMTSLPPQLQQLPPQMLVPTIIEQMINGKLVSAAGYAQKLQDDKEVKDRLKRAEERFVQEAYLNRTIGSKMTDAKLQEAYKKYLDENPSKEEIRARHILVDSEEKAGEILAKLAAGTDFAALASEASTDKAAAAQGGDLGYFSQDEMVPEFSTAAFALQPGQITPAAVKTQFGWHIIKVEDRRQSTPPTFEDIKDQLKSDVSQDLMAEVVEDLRKTAKIEHFQLDGSPVPSEAKPAEEKKPEPAPAPAAPAPTKDDKKKDEKKK